MINIRKSKDRGFFDKGWLKTSHTFSFGEYFNPLHRDFKSLRVINEDFIGPSTGFPTHFHRDMNIITFVIEGTLEHKDSMGNGSKIKKGEWQFMSAGSGVHHSEFNSSESEPVHLLQIWIKPNIQDLLPRYGQLDASTDSPRFWRTIATAEEKKDQIRLDQKASIHHMRMQANDTKELKLSFGTGFWIQLVKGESKINSQVIQAGDGASIEDESLVVLQALESNTEFVLFELE